MSIRVLCLHGADHTAYTLRCEVLQLDLRLRRGHSIELVYIDSPLCEDGSYSFGENNLCQEDASDGDELQDPVASDRKEEEIVRREGSQIQIAPEAQKTSPPIRPANKIITRKWFNERPKVIPPISSSPLDDDDDDDNSEPQSPKHHYIGMDASILHILQIWNRELHSRPFHGILAFHQGAALAALMPFLKRTRLEGLDFMILADGFVLNPPPLCCHHGVVDSRVETLLLIGKNNKKAAPKTSQQIARRFAKRQIYKYSSPPNSNARSFPNRPRDFNAIGKFLIARKNEITSRLSLETRLAIQETRLRLSLANANAENIIARTVAEAPPRALMAIIAPNAVGGWSGKKEKVTEDGGGAPCPKEFIYKKEEREEKEVEGSVGREHPNNQSV